MKAPSRRIDPSASGDARSLGQAGEPSRKATGHVEEVELLDVDREPAELGGERRQQCVAGRRLAWR